MALYLRNTASGKTHTNPPVCNTDVDSENMEEVERLDALGADLDKCSTCFDPEGSPQQARETPDEFEEEPDDEEE